MSTPTPIDPLSPEVLGPNNEKLPQDLQDELTTLIKDLKSVDAAARREEIRNVKKKRLFYAGQQYIFWDERRKDWSAANGSHGVLTSADTSDQPYQYVTNIYKGYSDTWSATLTSTPPEPRFFPQDPKSPEDVSTAEDASKVWELISRNNDMERLAAQEAKYLFDDGAAFWYVRPITDSDKYGKKSLPVFEEQDVAISEDTFSCPTCGWSGPEGPGPCPTCGMELTEDNFSPGVSVTAPVPVDQVEIANGIEMLSVYGKLEVRTPIRAPSLDEASFLSVSCELSQSRLKSLFPHMKEKIKAAGSEDAYEQNARRSVYGGSGSHQDDTKDQVTFERWWIRPWEFESREKDKAEVLKRLFPKGVYVAIAGNMYCESRPESIDDYWDVSYPNPGDGQMRSCPGDVMVPLQEQFNTFVNIEIDTYEHGIPMTFMSSRLIDSAKLRERPARPGEVWGVNDTPGQPVGAGIYETRTGQVSPQMVEKKRAAMGEEPQFCLGLFPALFGGGAVGTDTASGYAMQRDQALGRMGLPRRSVSATRARVAKKAVQCFAKNRPALEPGGEVAYAVFGPSGAIESKTISLERLKGQFGAYPESNDDFPATWTQRRNIAQTLLDSQNATIQTVMSTPGNFSSLMKEVGMKESFTFPEADARSHQMREIESMLKNMMPDPVDYELDNHAVHAAAIQEWAESDAGQAAALENPAGFEMVKQHFLEHQMVVQMQQAQQMAAEQQAAAPASGGAPSEEPTQDPAQRQLPY